MSETNLSVWRVDDGEQHWVTAVDEVGAVAAFLAGYGWTVESYPVETMADLADLEVTRVDDPSGVKWDDNEHPDVATLADALLAEPAFLESPTLLGSSCR